MLAKSPELGGCESGLHGQEVGARGRGGLGLADILAQYTLKLPRADPRLGSRSRGGVGLRDRAAAARKHLEGAHGVPARSAAAQALETRLLLAQVDLIAHEPAKAIELLRPIVDSTPRATEA